MPKGAEAAVGGEGLFMCGIVDGETRVGPRAPTAAGGAGGLAAGTRPGLHGLERAERGGYLRSRAGARVGQRRPGAPGERRARSGRSAEPGAPVVRDCPWPGGIPVAGMAETRCLP